MPASSVDSAFHRALALAVFVLSGLLAAAALPAGLHAQANSQRTVNLALVQGDVQLQQPGGQAVKAAARTSIRQGDTLIVGTGLAEIYFEDGATGFLNDNSKLTFTELATNGNVRVTRLTLSQGTARFFANTRGTNLFKIETPNFTASPDPLVDFSLKVDANGSTAIVARGTASLSSGTSTWTVDKGETSSLANGTTQAKTAPTPPSDIFQTWFPVYPSLLPGQQFPSGIPYTPPVYPYILPIPVPTGPGGIPTRTGPPPPRNDAPHGHVRP